MNTTCANPVHNPPVAAIIHELCDDCHTALRDDAVCDLCANPVRTRRAYTVHEDRRLLSGARSADLAIELGRTVGSIHGRRKWLRSR